MSSIKQTECVLCTVATNGCSSLRSDHIDAPMFVKAFLSVVAGDLRVVGCAAAVGQVTHMGTTRQGGAHRRSRATASSISRTPSGSSWRNPAAWSIAWASQMI
jgi:mannose/fructose/N-acetylgalactosamine-specific phosphotransferase system component IIC